MRRTVKEEGIASLWNGLLPQMLRFLITDSFNHYLTAYSKKLIPVANPADNYWGWFLGSLFSGSLAGAMSLFFVYPLDYATTRLNADIVQSNKGGTRQYSGVQDLITKTIATDGIAGLYQGYAVTCLGIIAYRAIYFGLYDSLRPLLPKKPKKPSFWTSFLLGWGVTVAAGLVTYPLDTIRRRQMMTCGESFKYSSSWNALTEIVTKEGVTALFNGALMNIVRSIVAATTLTLCDTIAPPPKANQKH